MQTRIKNKTSDTRMGYRNIFDADGCGTPEIFIKSKLSVYSVNAVGEVVVDREEFCATRARFSVLKDSIVSFNQGDAVSIKYKNESIFFGYVFSKSRSADGIIDVICYDQMRYMKNRRTYTRGKMRLDEIVNKIADDHSLRKGEISSCSVYLPAQAADNVSLLDVVKKACCEVYRKTGERYILFDKCGELCLKRESDMHLGIYIDASCAEDYRYTDSIDSGVYNKVEVYSDRKRYNTRYVATASDRETMDRWGVLILSKKAVEFGDEKAEAESLLKEYNRINREILIKNIPGDVLIMPGCGLYTRLDMGDLSIDGYMRVKRSVHRFENNMYSCDVYLDGGEIE